MLGPQEVLVVQPIDCGSGLGAYLPVGSSVVSTTVPKAYTAEGNNKASQFIVVTNLGLYAAHLAFSVAEVQVTNAYRAILPGCEVLYKVPALPPTDDLVVSAICKVGQSTELQMNRCYGN